MELYEYSDPEAVKEKAHELGLGDVHESSRKDKKYMIYDPYGAFWICILRRLHETQGRKKKTIFFK